MQRMIRIRLFQFKLEFLFSIFIAFNHYCELYNNFREMFLIIFCIIVRYANSQVHTLNNEFVSKFSHSSFQTPILLFINYEGPNHTLNQLSQKHDTVLIVQCHTSDNRCRTFVLEELRLSLQLLPVVLYKSGENKKYLTDGREVRYEKFSQFLQEVQQGSRKEYLQSSVIPQNNDGAVKVVVGDTFRELIQKSNKQILLKVYAPWGGHCKHLHPIFLKAAEKLSKNEKIMLAEIDGTQNQIPGLKIWAYPTIIYYPSNKQLGYTYYEGSRTVQHITKWLKSKTQFDWIQEL